MRVWWIALRKKEPLPTAETPPEPSHLWAPSGLIPTAEERAAMARSSQLVGGRAK
jgi:carbon starvation protein